MPDLLLLLIVSAAFVLVSCTIGSFLLWYVTGMPRFFAFFSTLQDTVSWALFVVLGLEALFTWIFGLVSEIVSWSCGTIAYTCHNDICRDLFLHTNWLTLFGLGISVTIIQFLLVRDRYRLDDSVLFSILGLSSLGGCIVWFVGNLIFL
jgi:hypothetical protein